MGSEGKFYSHVLQVGNVEFDPSPDAQAYQKWPWVPHFYTSQTHSISDMSTAATLYLYRDNSVVWNLKVFEYRQTGWGSEYKNTVNSSRQFGFANPNWWPDPWWDLTHKTTAYDERQPTNRYIETGAPSTVTKMRELTCFHPMVPKVLGFLEYVSVIPNNTTDVASWSVSYHFMGETRWQVVYS